MTTGKRTHLEAQTGTDIRRISGHFPKELTGRFKAVAANRGIDAHELLAEGINILLEEYGYPDRVDGAGGRITRRNPAPKNEPP